MLYNNYFRKWFENIYFESSEERLFYIYTYIYMASPTRLSHQHLKPIENHVPHAATITDPVQK